MDTFKLKLLSAAVLILVTHSAHAELFDMSEHSGIIKDSTGNFYKINSAGTVSALKSGTTLNLTEKVSIPTSKGFFSVELSRSAPVEVNRIGKAVRGLAVATGPLGLAITAVDAICTLTTICNDAGNWIFGASEADQVANLVGGWVGNYDTSPLACASDVDGRGCASVVWGSAFNIGGFSYSIQSDRINAEVRLLSKTTGADMGAGKLRKFISNFAPQPQAPATAANWDAKESLLNDAQFIDELLAKGAPVPVGSPTITAPVNVPIGSSTKTTKDANGNVTGTETTTSQATVSEPTSGENPSGSPTIIKITENHTTNNYNTNNELTGSTTTTTGGTSQPQQQSQSVEIEIDNIQATPLQERAVPFPFETDSWGSGSCPSDRTVNYHYGTLNLTFEPACQFAEGIKPIVLILAGFIAMFIIMGATKDAN